MLVCFDVDGTLADGAHRVHYWRQKPRNWDMFRSEIINDAPIQQICDIAKQMPTAHDLIVCTGRGEDSRDVTTKWLHKNSISFQKMYMRTEHDYRDDYIVKKELLDEIIDDYGKQPDLWFDDRPSVVKMLKANGVFVADVYQKKKYFQ